jgi:hypothetical protein
MIKRQTIAVCDYCQSEVEIITSIEGYPDDWIFVRVERADRKENSVANVGNLCSQNCAVHWLREHWPKSSHRYPMGSVINEEKEEN